MHMCWNKGKGSTYPQMFGQRGTNFLDHMTKEKSTVFGSVCIHVARLWSYLCLPSINIANDDLGNNYTLFHIIQLGIC